MEDEFYTPDEIATLLKVSKLTVYDLIKKEDIKAFRVGRQMRVEAKELERYKEGNASSADRHTTITTKQEGTNEDDALVISGQDASLDLLVRHMEEEVDGNRPLRSYAGSLDSLIEMYQGQADIVSVHLFDGDTGTYNVPYVRKMLVSKSFQVIGFIKRQAGLFVADGNPKNIQSWNDLARDDVQIINREAGAGARVLLDEQLRLHNLSREAVRGYGNIRLSHMDIASEVANGRADAGVGIENIAKVAPVDFVPLIEESYDLVVLQSRENKRMIDALLAVLAQADFREKLRSFSYDTEEIGTVRWKQ